MSSDVIRSEWSVVPNPYQSLERKLDHEHAHCLEIAKQMRDPKNWLDERNFSPLSTSSLRPNHLMQDLFDTATRFLEQHQNFQNWKQEQQKKTSQKDSDQMFKSIEDTLNRTKETLSRQWTQYKEAKKTSDALIAEKGELSSSDDDLDELNPQEATKKLVKKRHQMSHELSNFDSRRLLRKIHRMKKPYERPAAVHESRRSQIDFSSIETEETSITQEVFSTISSPENFFC